MLWDSGIADTYEYHLELMVKPCVEQRGFPENIDDDPVLDPPSYPEQSLRYFIVQMNKSICQI